MGLREDLQDLQDRAASGFTGPTFEPLQLPAPVERVDTAQVEVLPAPEPYRSDSIANFQTALGTTRDKGQAARPSRNLLPLSFAELYILYRHNGYAKRFVDVVPDNATKKNWRLLLQQEKDADPGEKVKVQAEFQQEILNENKRLSLVSKTADANRWGRLFGGALMLMITEDDIPGDFDGNAQQWLAQPLDLDKVKRLQNLVVLDAVEFTAQSYNDDLTSPRFGRVETWSINASTGGHSVVGTIHATRALYWPGAKLPPSRSVAKGGIDDSVLQAAWDQLRNKTSVDQGGAVQAQQLTRDILTIKDVSTMTLSDQAATFAMRMKALAMGLSANNMAIMNEGEDFKSHVANVTGFDKLDNAARSALAAATGMSQVRLFGETPGGLNSDGESSQRHDANMVAGVQETIYRPNLEPLYTVMLAASEGPFAGLEADWNLEFVPLGELTKKEEAEIGEINSRTDKNYTDAGVLPADHVAASRFGPGGDQGILPIDAEAEDAADLERTRLAMEEEKKRIAEEQAAE